MSTRPRQPLSTVLAALLAAGALGASCQPQAAPGDDPVVGVVAGEEVTAGELEAWIKQELYQEAVLDQSEGERFTVQRDALVRLFDERVIAEEVRRRGLADADALFEAETAGAGEVDPAVVEEIFEDNRERLGDRTLEEIGPQIEAQLARRQRQQAWQDYVAGLREQAGASVRLEVPRVEVAAIGPARGPDTAPVTIVAFTDYECPFCHRAEPVIAELLARYPDQIRIVLRHYPLESIHPNARGAAEASLCADAQGRFWDFHDALFAEARKLPADVLLEVATEVELDLDAFRACTEGGEMSARVGADIEAGEQAGVTGTPAFFINGRRVAGARSIEYFVEIVDEELARAPAPPAEGEAS